MQRDVYRAADFLHWCINYNDHNHLINFSPPSMLARWSPLSGGHFKINFDDVIFSDLSCYGFGIIIWDNNDCFLVGYELQMHYGGGMGKNDSNPASNCFCSFTGKTRVWDIILEGDNLSIIKSIRNNIYDFNMMGNVLVDINRWKSHIIKFSQIRILICYKQSYDKKK